jgi:peptidoglycan/LPS O-acetylase OafA/YrhL
LASRRYVPQLDGVRAIAISAVVAYHLGYLHGGWVGVDVFFVLSGYLITGLLLEVDRPPGQLAAFWGRRAKRLLPAVLILLAALSIYAWDGGPGLVPAQLRGPSLATLFYVANWNQIAVGHGYFAQFLSVSPLQQTWSLAIEEQYYVLWPLIILGITAIARFRRRDASRSLLGLTLALALVSAVWMGVAAHWLGPNRAYLGTDTRAWELLMGGAAAMVWPLGRARSLVHQRLWSILSMLGIVGVALGAALAGGPPGWIWNGGLVVIAACALLIIVGALHVPHGPVGRVLALAPLRWLGVISYSLYLWHWPVIVLMTGETTGWSGAQLLVARVGTMIVLSCLSFYLVERPLRRTDWAALRRRVRVPALGFVAAGVALTVAVILAGTVGPPQADTAQVAAAPKPAHAVTPLRIRLRPPRSGQKYQAWIFGDSVMFDSSPGITAALQATGDVSVAVNSSFPGWGLTIDRSWAGGVRQTLAQHPLQIAIGTWSWDDQLAAADPAAYRALLTRYVADLLAPPDGVKLVVLLQFPQQGPSESIADVAARAEAWTRQTEVTDAWDEAARRVVTAFPGRALYLTTSQLFAPKGSFLTWMRTPKATWVRARKLDNTHMCPYGAAKFGALVTAELTPMLHLGALKPGWEFADWTKDPRYNDPPGACPDDQPPAGYRGLRVPVRGSASEGKGVLSSKEEDSQLRALRPTR